MLNKLSSGHHRGIKRMPPRSEKHENFRRLAQARTERVLDDLRKLSNLSSSNYEFEESEVDKIFAAIDEAVQVARGRFGRGPNKPKSFRL